MWRDNLVASRGNLADIVVSDIQVLVTLVRSLIQVLVIDSAPPFLTHIVASQGVSHVFLLNLLLICLPCSLNFWVKFEIVDSM